MDVCYGETKWSKRPRRYEDKKKYSLRARAMIFPSGIQLNIIYHFLWEPAVEDRELFLRARFVTRAQHAFVLRGDGYGSSPHA